MLGKAILVSLQEIGVNKGKLPTPPSLVSLQSLSIAPLMLETKTTLAGAGLPGDAIDPA